MARYRIKKACLTARVVTTTQWHKEFAHLDELIRPVVLRVNENQRLVTIRPKTEDEIREIKKRRGLPNDEMVTVSSSLVDDAPRLDMGEL